MSKQLVFITSRAHSGSTLLNLLMSSQPRLIALGEVFSLFDFKAGHIFRQDKIHCSCGESMSRCPFWGPLTDHLRRNQNLSQVDMYNLVLDSFYDYFGEDYIPVDSSKTLDALSYLLARKMDLRVIFLVRDVRPWMISMRKDRESRGDLWLQDLVKRYGIKAPVEWVLRSPYKYFWHWYLLNRKTQRFLTQSDVPFLQIGYEEICFYPELMISKMGEFLDLDLDPRMVSLGASENHVILGNRMRHQPDKRTQIHYDHRWFYSGSWLMPSLLFPNIMNFNAREVYLNTRQPGSWKK